MHDMIDDLWDNADEYGCKFLATCIASFFYCLLLTWI